MKEEVSVCSKNLFLNHALLLSKIRFVSVSSGFYGVVLRTPVFSEMAPSHYVIIFLRFERTNSSKRRELTIQ